MSRGTAARLIVGNRDRDEALATMRRVFPGVATFARLTDSAIPYAVGYVERAGGRFFEHVMGRGKSWDRAIENAIRRNERAPLNRRARRARRPGELEQLALQL